MDDIKKITNDLESIFLKKIIMGLRDGSINIADSKRFANLFLSLEPFSSIDEAKNKMTTFSAQNTHFADLQNYMNAYHEEKKVGEVIEKMRKFIKNNDVDNALKVATTS